MSSSVAAACCRTPSFPRVSALRTFVLASLLLPCAFDAAARDAHSFGLGGFTVGGTVSGLIGTDMVLTLNGGSPLLVGANGSFTFATALGSGATYAVQIAQQPVDPNQLCVVENDEGTIGAGNVTDVIIDCAPVEPHLTLSVTDNHDHARYGMTVDYVIELSNAGTGDAQGLSLAAVPTPQLDEGRMEWSCVGAGAGATCTGSGSGILTDSGIALPAGRSLTWLVSAPVRESAAGITLDFTVDATGAGDASATDSDTLVLLRTGFDVNYSDGAE